MTYTIVAGRPTYEPYVDPTDSAMYGIDVAGELSDGDAITGTPTVTVSAGTVGAASVAGTIIKARASALPAGATVSMTFTFSTTGGDTFQRSIYLPVKQR